MGRRVATLNQVQGKCLVRDGTRGSCTPEEKRLRAGSRQMGRQLGRVPGMCAFLLAIECAFALRQVPGARQGEPKEGSVRVRCHRLTAIAVRRAETSADNKMHV
jgi:hypothetical protein